jgi:hypothetical protein
MQDFGLVLVPCGGGAVGVEDQGPAPAVDDDRVVEGAKKHAVLMGVLPPWALCLVWCTSQAPAGWVQPPGKDTHWSRASMARRTGLSKSTIGRIWKKFDLKPHLQDTFKLSWESILRHISKGVVSVS